MWAWPAPGDGQGSPPAACAVCAEPSPCRPQGVRLLSYLYQEALDNCSNEHYPVLLSLLKTSCEPYTRWGPHGLGVPARRGDQRSGRRGEGGMGGSDCGLRGAALYPRGCHPPHHWPARPGRFIHDWVYSGVFRDVYGEFMIQVNHEYLGFRGRWWPAAGWDPTPSGGSGPW